MRSTAGVGVGISGACEPPLAWRARKPLPWALRSSAALALGLAMPRAPATELVFWHRVSDCAPKGCGLLFSFLFLFYLFALSALACCSEVTVTSVSLPPFVSRRGLSNTNQRLSLLKRETDQRECALARNFIYRTRPHWEPPKRPKWWQGKNRKKEGKGAPVSQARAHLPRQPRHSGGQVSGEGDSLDLEWRDYD